MTHAAADTGHCPLDAAKIKALSAPRVIGFGYADAPLTTDRATWDKAQDAYAAARIDGATRQRRAIQILAPTRS